MFSSKDKIYSHETLGGWQEAEVQGMGFFDDLLKQAEKTVKTYVEQAPQLIVQAGTKLIDDEIAKFLGTDKQSTIDNSPIVTQEGRIITRTTDLPPEYRYLSQYMEPKKDNTLLYVGLGVGGVALTALLIVLLRR
jgi:hypothetical protein